MIGLRPCFSVIGLVVPRYSAGGSGSPRACTAGCLQRKAQKINRERGNFRESRRNHLRPWKATCPFFRRRTAKQRGNMLPWAGDFPSSIFCLTASVPEGCSAHQLSNRLGESEKENSFDPAKDSCTAGSYSDLISFTARCTVLRVLLLY